MKYKINWDSSDGVFAVPDAAADCLKLASGKAVKVLLYILKNKNADADFEEIGAAVGISGEDAEDAFSYWQQVGILYPDGARPDNTPKRLDTPAETEKPALSSSRASEKASKMLSPAEISERINSSSEIQFLFTAAENTFGRLLTYTEQRTIIWLYDYYGIAPDILLMIMEFAKSQNKTSIGFVEKIAANWHDDGISTHEQAEREIKRLQNYYSLAGQVTAKLGLNRTLTPRERGFVDTWASRGTGIDLILYAYEKTVDNTGKVSFSYMNKILDDWYSKGIFTVSDVKAAESKRAADEPAANSDEHSYNLDLLVAHAMNNTPKIK